MADTQEFRSQSACHLWCFVADHGWLALAPLRVTKLLGVWSLMISAWTIECHRIDLFRHASPLQLGPG